EAVDRQRETQEGEEQQRDEQLEREALLEGGLLVGLVLLDVFVADAELLEPRKRDQRGDENAPDAELRPRKEGGDQEAPQEAESGDRDLERGVDQRAAHCVLAQRPALQVDALLDRRIGRDVVPAHVLRWRRLLSHDRLAKLPGPPRPASRFARRHGVPGASRRHSESRYPGQPTSGAMPCPCAKAAARSASPSRPAFRSACGRTTCA